MNSVIGLQRDLMTYQGDMHHGPPATDGAR
jgi:hypothetical protein